ncbi:MAG: zinc-dependent metalloprotease [Chloroflexi bacterium]|nr:zinc-dependent metalloprotease [Chloroflexota bacterium]
MAGYAAFGRGVLIGAGVAVALAAAKASRTLESPAADQAGGRGIAGDEKLIDWRLAERIARRAAGTAPALHPALRDRLQADYEGLLRDIEAPIARYTGIALDLARTRIEVMDRPAWIRANMRSFRDLLAPVEEFYREETRGGAGASVAMIGGSRLVLSTQMGLLVGYLARRVMGQYDLSLLGTEPLEGGQLYFVEPNLQHVERTLRVPGDEFRRWIALHEATHALEFEAHPWVRDHLNTLMRSYLRLLTEDMRRQKGTRGLLSLSTRLVDNLRNGHSVIEALQTGPQRELLSQLQALMSLAEGYSNHVMNAVGRTMLPNFDMIHDRVEHRQRERSHAELWFLRVTGLGLKMEQYRRGQAFVDAVTAAHGVEMANRAWVSPANLPTEAELGTPEAWVARLRAQSA